jgi:hypothetical protein
MGVLNVRVGGRRGYVGGKERRQRKLPPGYELSAWFSSSRRVIGFEKIMKTRVDAA